MLKKLRERVYVIVSCPPVTDLKHKLIAELYQDLPIDRFIEASIERLLSDILISFIENGSEDFINYEEELKAISILISEHVSILEIRSVSIMYDDTLLLQC